jgi:DNA-binding winged helix-turn-helix (wHTH) protein
VRLRFGPFTLDSETRQLIGEQGEVPLTRKAFDLLLFLVDERPKVLRKTDLLARVWPDTHVVDANLNVLIGELRRALGDDSREPRFIRTVHGTGFAFVGDATDLATPSGKRGSPRRCWLAWHERRFMLEDGSNLIGRDPGCDVWIDASRVSREHARVVVDSASGRVTVEDVGSTNGTFVGASPVVGSVALSDGDVLQIGSVELTFRVWNEKQAETERIRPPSRAD